MLALFWREEKEDILWPHLTLLQTFGTSTSGVAIVDLDSTTKTKFSRHLIVTSHVFQNIRQMKLYVADLCQTIRTSSEFRLEFSHTQWDSSLTLLITMQISGRYSLLSNTVAAGWFIWNFFTKIPHFYLASLLNIQDLLSAAKCSNKLPYLEFFHRKYFIQYFILVFFVKWMLPK